MDAASFNAQWDAVCENLGDWNGTFTRYDDRMMLISQSLSRLEFKQSTQDQCLDFRLRLWDVNQPLDGGDATKEINLQLQSFSKDYIYFPGGAFCAATLAIDEEDIAKVEFSFIRSKRRHRQVFLFNRTQGVFQRTLIREANGMSAPLDGCLINASFLVGSWRVSQRTFTDQIWPQSVVDQFDLDVDQSLTQQLVLFHDNGAARLPSVDEISKTFAFESYWCCDSGRLQRSVIEYSADGTWQASRFAVMKRI